MKASKSKTTLAVRARRAIERLARLQRGDLPARLILGNNRSAYRLADIEAWIADPKAWVKANKAERARQRSASYVAAAERAEIIKAPQTTPIS